ncbi:hypothetical protein Tco_0972744 [Tanacetum coccineum]
MFSKEADVVTLLKRIRKFFMAQDIGARAAVHIFNRISFAIAKEVGAQIVSRLPSNLLCEIVLRILAGQIGNFAAMADDPLVYHVRGTLLGSKVVSKEPCIPFHGLVKVADKSEIVRILAGQIGKFAAMADMIRILAGQIGKFAAMAVMMILLNHMLHFDTADYLIISKSISNIFIEVERGYHGHSLTLVPDMGERRQSEPRFINVPRPVVDQPRLLRSEIGTDQAMAESDCNRHIMFHGKIKRQGGCPVKAVMTIDSVYDIRQYGDGGRRVARSLWFRSHG